MSSRIRILVSHGVFVVLFAITGCSSHQPSSASLDEARENDPSITRLANSPDGSGWPLQNGIEMFDEAGHLTPYVGVEDGTKVKVLGDPARAPLRPGQAEDSSVNPVMYHVQILSGAQKGRVGYVEDKAMGKHTE